MRDRSLRKSFPEDNDSRPLSGEKPAGGGVFHGDELCSWRGLTLDRFQAEAINHIRAGSSVLVSAPTGTGKTLIADYVIDQAMAAGTGAVYTAPIKALSNQKYRDYSNIYGKDKVGLVTGDLVIRREAPIRIMTTEILRNILLQEGSGDDAPLGFSDVVIDEVHFLDDDERGTVWEELLIYLPSTVRIVALSATLPNIHEFAAWLEEVRGTPVAVVTESKRSVPLRIFLANRDVGILEPGRFERAYRARRSSSHKTNAAAPPSRDKEGERRFPRSRASVGRERARAKRTPKTTHLDMLQLAYPDYFPVLYFIFSRRQTELFAKELATRTPRSFLKAEDKRAIRDRLREFDSRTPGVLTPAHRTMYLAGIAFHHAGLHVALKALVEELYEKRLIQVLYCTSTFALGLNMPARTVIFDSITKFNGVGIEPLTVRQFLQKAGRAGRRGLDREGNILIRQDFQDYPRNRALFSIYQRGEHEEIGSAFNLSFSSVANLLHQHSEAEIHAILQRSFLGFRLKQHNHDDLEEVGRLRRRLAGRRRTETKRPSTGDEDTAPMSAKQMKKRIRVLERRRAGRENFLISRFNEKVDFLKLAGYIDDDGRFNAGGRALMHIQISEIFVTELILDGVFDELEEDELFGVLTSLVQDLPRGVMSLAPHGARWRYLRDRIRRILESEIVRESEVLMNSPVTYCPELIAFGRMWAEGCQLSAIMRYLKSPTDISGDMVSAFRRAKDLAGQIRAATRSNDVLATRLTHLISKVSRDEVEVLD